MSGPANDTPEDVFAVPADVESLKRRTVVGSVVTVGSQGALAVIQLCSQIVLSHLLLPADFGLLAMAAPVIGFLSIFGDIGLGQAIVQRKTLTQDQVSSLFWANTLISAVIGLLAMAASPFAALLYGESRLAPLLVVLGLLIPFNALKINPNAILVRQMRFGRIAFNEIVSAAVGLVAAIAGALAGLAFWSLVLGQAVGTAAALATTWAACRWRPSRPGITRAVAADLGFGGNLTLANLATFATTSADNVIVGLMAGKVALGLYDRSYRLVVQPLGQLIAPFSRVAVPMLARLDDQPASYRNAYRTIYVAMQLLTVPAMLVCMSNAPDIVELLLGRQWAGAAPVFAWICVGGLTSAIYSSFFWVFISQGRTREMRTLTFVSAVLNVMSFVVGAYWGIVGVAALGSTVFVLVTTPLMMHGVARRGHVGLGDLVRPELPIVAQGIAAYGAVALLLQATGLGGVWGIMASTALAYSVFGLSALAVPVQRAALLQLAGAAKPVLQAWRS